ncbi:hypothetical protein IQ266_10250 [filamentous cyanobacterium LEGE 11480]|uniref:Uncharacterized protein n=1 Tax=Romeriopsis navalis LEGE 11480 TaxID=2777977 RepID=A0A928Z300_9CYAN|nr:hypothetical protein [Romeriopsis navalis]MBE9030109.1 hypothetical protein [Romeriopsis navalis LEGE 11480]
MPATIRYQEQNSTQTLQEALDEYHALNPNLLKPDEMSANGAELFSNHDLIHVVFGLDTSLHDETLADTWTIFGSSIGFWEYLKYIKNPEAMQVLQDLSVNGNTNYLTIAKEAIRAIPDVFKVIRRSRQMTQKWPWQNHQSYRLKTLGQIRQELGIQLIATASEVMSESHNSLSAHS